jgi:hypothetical protein
MFGWPMVSSLCDHGPGTAKSRGGGSLRRKKNVVSLEVADFSESLLLRVTIERMAAT